MKTEKRLKMKLENRQKTVFIFPVLMMVCCFRPCFYRKTKKQGEYIKSILWKFDNQELRCKGEKAAMYN